MSLENEIKKEEKQIEKNFKKINLWMIASIILVIALVAVAVWPDGVSETKAGDILINTLNTKTGGGVTLKAIEDQGSLYEATVIYQGQEIPIYVTRAGDYVVYQAEKVTSSDASVDTNTASDVQVQTEVVKSDKPVVEAFVFTYCPYGLQFQKALAPVYDLLKDKADINLVQIGAMHGEHEKIEAERQLCIQREYGKDKLWAYVNLFQVNTTIGACSSDAACKKPLVEALMTQVGIDAAKIDSCIETDGEDLYDADGARASSLGISGSPTFVINGAEVQVSRTPEAIKTAVCDAFTDESKPSECSQTLSTSAMVAGFGGSAGTSTGASC